MRIGIIGAGHAGVSAAREVTEAGASATLFSAEEVLPYFRPRIVALAFGLVEEEKLYMHPSEWYENRGIELQLSTPVLSVSPSELKVRTTDNRDHYFDELILACGAEPNVLPWTRELGSGACPMWTLQHARQLKPNLQQADAVTIVGGSLTGVEAALYAAEQEKTTTIVEKAEHLMPFFLGEKAASVLQSRLRRQNINLETGQTITEAEPRENRFQFRTDTDKLFPTDTIITAVGGKPQLSPYKDTTLNIEKGICVEDTLSSSVPGVFACGDVAQCHGRTLANVSTATTQGRIAGRNAIAYIENDSLQSVPSTITQMSLKYGDFQLHVAGQKPDADTEEKLLSSEDEHTHRGVVLNQNHELTGIQMVGTGKDFQKLTKCLGMRWEEIDLS